MAPTLYIAPVGMQPAAVAAPVVSLMRGMHSGDTIWLLTTRGVTAAGHDRRLENLVLRRLRERTLDVRVVCLDVARYLEEPIDPQTAGIVVIANGGEARSVHAIVTDLRALLAKVPMRIVSSNDVRGTFLDVDGNVTDVFEVEDLGLDALLELLQVSRLTRDGCSILKSAKGDEIFVRDVLERAGQLHAIVPLAQKPPPGTNLTTDERKAYNSRRLADYRAVREWRGLQQDMGLELRRMLMVPDGFQVPIPDPPATDTWPERLRIRAQRDGAVVLGMRHRKTGQHINEDAWRRLVADGTASSIPELRAQRITQLSYTRTGPCWSGPPLVCIMGPQPGATLRALWLHEPRNAYLLYDEESAASAAALEFLVTDPKVQEQLRCESVTIVPGNRLSMLTVPDGAHVCMTAGDKRSRLNLLLEPGLRHARFCNLRGNVSECAPDIVRPVPIDVWLRMHASTLPLGTDAAPGYDLGAMRALVEAIEAHGTNRLLKAGALNESLRPLLMQVFESGPRRREYLEGGRWLEPIVASLLARVRGSEVVKNITYGSRQRNDGKIIFDDEIDVIAGLAGAYTLVSCKATQYGDGTSASLREARSQADRLVGRNELSAVVVPSLRAMNPRKQWAEHAERGFRVHPDYGPVVDLRFLLDPENARSLLSPERHAAGPRAPNAPLWITPQ